MNQQQPAPTADGGQAAYRLDILRAAIASVDPHDAHQFLCGDAECWVEMARIEIDAAARAAETGGR